MNLHVKQDLRYRWCSLETSTLHPLCGGPTKVGWPLSVR